MQKSGGPHTMTSRRTKSKVDQQIDENLKRVYADVLNEDVPDRFLSLIEQLKHSERPKNQGRKDFDDA